MIPEIEYLKNSQKTFFFDQYKKSLNDSNKQFKLEMLSPLNGRMRQMWTKYYKKKKIKSLE